MSEQEEAEINFRTRQAVLVEDQDGPPFKINGVILAPGDITNGKNGRKKWPEATLKEIAPTFEGRPLVRDHINSVLGNVGEITKTRYEEGRGILLEAELDDEDLAEKIEMERLEVSALIKHLPKERLEKDEQDDAWVIDTPAVAENLSIVNSGASPSNEVQMGEAAALEEDELQEAFSEDANEGDEAETEESVDEEQESESGSVDESDDSPESEGNESSEAEEPDNEQTEESQDDKLTIKVDDPSNRARTAESAELSREAITTLNMKEFDIDTDVLPEEASLSEPVVVDESELEDLREKANRADEDFEDLRQDIAELSSIKSEKEELESEVAELREKAAEVEEVKKMQAEQLADAAGDVVETDDFMHLELSELRERVDALEEESEDAELEDNNPDPQSEDVENAELEDNPDDEVDESEIAELEDKLDWYERHGWNSAAEDTRAELEELKGE